MNKLTHTFLGCLALFTALAFLSKCQSEEVERYKAELAKEQEGRKEDQGVMEHYFSIIEEIQNRTDSLVIRNQIFRPGRDPVEFRRTRGQAIIDDFQKISDLIDRTKMELEKQSQDAQQYKTQLDHFKRIVERQNREIRRLKAEIAQLYSMNKELNQNNAYLSNTLSNQQVVLENQLQNIVGLQQTNIDLSSQLEMEKENNQKLLNENKTLAGKGNKSKYKCRVTLANGSVIEKEVSKNFIDFKCEIKKKNIKSILPKDSYSLGNHTIIIKDPAAFWSHSNVLLITIDENSCDFTSN